MYIRNAYCNLLPAPEETTRLLPAPASPAPARICFGSPAAGGPAARDHDCAGGTGAAHDMDGVGEQPAVGIRPPAKYVLQCTREMGARRRAKTDAGRGLADSDAARVRLAERYCVGLAWAHERAAKARTRKALLTTGSLAFSACRASTEAGSARHHPAEIVWAHSQPGRLRAGMQRASHTPSVSGNGRAGTAAVQRACRKALDAAADRGRASCAEWAGAQWAAEHCMIGRPPRLWQVPGLGWAVPGQPLGLRVRG
jgi:hypothetical protein